LKRATAKNWNGDWNKPAGWPETTMTRNQERLAKLIRDLEEQLR
jgi:hypothetical protein